MFIFLLSSLSGVLSGVSPEVIAAEDQMKCKVILNEIRDFSVSEHCQKHFE